MTDILEVRDLRYSYDGIIDVIHDVSLTVDAGEVVGLIGPNGSGKSTLIKNIFDLVRMQKGEVLIDGHAHSSISARLAAIHLASNDYLPQFLTGREYAAMLARLFDEPLDEVLMDDLFRRFSMDGRQRDLIENYSHGMCKKTQLITALLLRRPLTVIDETLNGIDVEALHLCEKEFRALRDEGRSILLCSHDFGLLERLADRIVFLDLGHLVSADRTVALVEEHGSLAEMVFQYLDADRD